jgi:hypothetical protein
MRLLFTALTLIILLAGCSDSYDDKDAKFRSFVSKNQMGGKDSVAAVVTTVVVEEITKAKIKDVFKERHDKRK